MLLLSLKLLAFLFIIVVFVINGVRCPLLTLKEAPGLVYLLALDSQDILCLL